MYQDGVGETQTEDLLPYNRGKWPDLRVDPEQQ